jgi:hypothetical protein
MGDHEITVKKPIIVRTTSPIVVGIVHFDRRPAAGDITTTGSRCAQLCSNPDT